MSNAAEVELDRVVVDGRTIAYRSTGEGPPLVLLHSALSDSREWWLQLEGFAADFRVIAWDAPGCGASSDPPEDFSLSDYADAAVGLMRALDLERPHLLGLSFGGGLALEISRRYPDLARSLVLASAYAGWAGSLSPDVVTERVRSVLADTNRHHEEWAPSYLASFFAGPVAREAVDNVLAIMCDARPAGIRPMVRAFANADLRGALERISVPALVLAGERDERAPVAVARDLHARIPGSELVVIPGVGHVLNIEAPEAFDFEVRRFLEAIPG